MDPVELLEYRLTGALLRHPHRLAEVAWLRPDDFATTPAAAVFAGLRRRALTANLGSTGAAAPRPILVRLFELQRMQAAAATTDDPLRDLALAVLEQSLRAQLRRLAAQIGDSPLRPWPEASHALHTAAYAARWDLDGLTARWRNAHQPSPRPDDTPARWPSPDPDWRRTADTRVPPPDPSAVSRAVNTLLRATAQERLTVPALATLTGLQLRGVEDVRSVVRLLLKRENTLLSDSDPDAVAARDAELLHALDTLRAAGAHAAATTAEADLTRSADDPTVSLDTALRAARVTVDELIARTDTPSIPADHPVAELLAEHHRISRDVTETDGAQRQELLRDRDSLRLVVDEQIADLPPTARHEPLADTIHPGLVDDPSWPQLATHLDARRAAGSDTETLGLRLTAAHVDADQPVEDLLRRLARVLHAPARRRGR